MAFTDLIKPGDKIDIRLLQQVENEERTGDTVKVYKSQVLDINKRGNLEISMPTEGTKLILLQLYVRLEFVFYSGGFLYKTIAQIVERFKRDNIYTLEVELKTRLEKFQRREFYRRRPALPSSSAHWISCTSCARGSRRCSAYRASPSHPATTGRGMCGSTPWRCWIPPPSCGPKQPSLWP